MGDSRLRQIYKGFVYLAQGKSDPGRYEKQVWSRNRPLYHYHIIPST